jgi:DNA-directed RNA polymerase subunit RPC12/RpoP
MTTIIRTERIRCPSCSQLIPVPVGDAHWQTAPCQPGWITPVEALACPHCRRQIGVVALEWLVTVPMRMKELASWGAVLCARRGQQPTHEDLDQVEIQLARQVANP